MNAPLRHTDLGDVSLSTPETASFYEEPEPARASEETTFVSQLLRAIGINAYDERWEALQRNYQNKAVARAFLDTLPSSLIVFIGAISLADQYSDPSLIYLAAGMIVFFVATNMALLPGMPWCKVTYSSEKSASMASIVLPILSVVPWSLFAYSSIVYLPSEWNDLSIAVSVGAICVMGIGLAYYPSTAFLSMCTVTAGVLMGIQDAGRPYFGYWAFAIMMLVVVVTINCLHFAQDALAKIRDEAELKHSEGQKREAIERQHEAEKQLIAAREAELVQEQEAASRRKQELLELAAQFESNIGEVSNSVASAAEQLHASAKSLATAPEDAIGQSAQISDAIQQVASGSSAAAAVSDEFALSIQEISRQAANSAELARSTNAAAISTDTTVSKLTERAQSIGEIAELIDAIAQRTNLLALNASIEAARSSEAGRGFAVVASEVKELAHQTSNATSDVTGNIREMQERSDASANELRSICRQIKELETAAIAIASAVDQQSVAGKELAMSVDLAAAGAEQVSASSLNLRNAAEAAGGAAEQFLGASDNIKAQATTLNEKVGSFLKHIRDDG